AEHAVVSPANSQGFMDGGFDRALVAYFGPSLESRIRAAMLARPEGHLPVGASLVVETAHTRIPYVIVAPTMTSPEYVHPFNAQRAMRAVLRAASTLPTPERGIWRPGLCTGVGGVAPEDAATHMAAAFRDWLRS